MLSRPAALTLVDCRRRRHTHEPFGCDLGGAGPAGEWNGGGEWGEGGEENGASEDQDLPFVILLAFSGLRESLTATGYNSRVVECRSAARLLLAKAAAAEVEAEEAKEAEATVGSEVGMGAGTDVEAAAAVVVDANGGSAAGGSSPRLSTGSRIPAPRVNGDTASAAPAAAEAGVEGEGGRIPAPRDIGETAAPRHRAAVAAAAAAAAGVGGDDSGVNAEHSSNGGQGGSGGGDAGDSGGSGNGDSDGEDGFLLSNVSVEVFARHGASLPEIERKRATHYFGESARVAAGVAAWRRGDLGRDIRLPSHVNPLVS